MDHTFSTTAIRQHHHHQQSVRNSLSPSPAAINSFYRISSSPTNTTILTASTGISTLPYTSNKTSPTPTCYPTASPQTVVNPASVSVSNLFRVPTLTVQQQQQQQLQQYLQTQITPQNPTSFAYTSSSSETSYNPNRLPAAQYPLRQKAGNFIQHQQPQLSRNTIPIQASAAVPSLSYSSPSNLSSRGHGTTNYSISITPLSDNNFRNQQQQVHQPLSHSHSTRHQYQQQQHPQPTYQSVQTHYPSQSKSQPQPKPTPSPKSMNSAQIMNKNRFVSSVQQPQAGINSNGVSPNCAAHIHQSQQQISQSQNQNNQMNSVNNNAAPPATSGNNSSPPQTQPQYRIFKRGDSIPGISSPIQITSQGSGAGDNGTQPNSSDSSASHNDNRDHAKKVDANALGASDSTENQNGSNKENTNVSSTAPKSPGDSKSNSTANLRTPLSQIGEIARYHSLQVEYRLVKETGPPHAPTFTVLLHLGNEEFTGEGQSIKKAQHAAATEALEKTQMTRPPPRSKPKKAFSSHSHAAGNGVNKRPNWTLVQLTSLAQEMQLQLQFVQQPVAIMDPFRRGEPPSIVSVHVGERIFTGEGSNFNAAKNMAVMIALKAMMKVKQEMDLARLAQAGADAEQNMMEADNKSPISIVHEMAMKRNLSVVFEIVQETGPPHMKVFTVKCKVGDELDTEGQGPTKQAAKKASSELMIAKLKEIPIQLPATSQGLNIKAMQRGLLRQKLSKKKTSTPVVKDLENQSVSPISRLIQICHIKKLKEPEFTLISTGTETNVENFLKQITERDRRMLRKKKPVFTIEVTVGSHTCSGTGPNKKAAKKAAAEAAIIALGYGSTEGAAEAEDDEESQGQATKVNEKSGNKTNSTGAGGTKGNAGKGSGGGGGGSQTDRKSGGSASSSTSVKLAGARQIAPGIIVLKQEKCGTGGTSSTTAAQEMKKVNNLMTPSSIGGAQSSREGIEKLAYLSKLLDISVSYSDFPKKNEYLSVVSLTTNPPHVAHGCGGTLEEAQNAAALKILEELSTMDLDSVTAAAEKTSE